MGVFVWFWVWLFGFGGVCLGLGVFVWAWGFLFGFGGFCLGLGGFCLFVLMAAIKSPDKHCLPGISDDTARVGYAI